MQLLRHVAVDRLVAHREDEPEPEQRYRQEGNRRLREADQQPAPLGVRHLVDRRERHAAAGEPGVEHPVEVERLPGAVVTRARQGHHEEHQTDQRDDDAGPEHAAVTPAGEPVLDEAIAQFLIVREVHQSCPPATGASDCSLRTYITTAQRAGA
jgi:hypothetical protein